MVKPSKAAAAALTTTTATTATTTDILTVNITGNLGVEWLDVN